MTEKKVIVTLIDSNGSDLGDYELTADQRIERLYPGLIETLCRYALHFERREISLGLRDGGRTVPIPDGDTLTAHGVQDGCYLHILPGGSAG